VLLIPVAGVLSDRIDRQLLAMAAALAVLLLAYPLFAFLVAVPTLSTLLIVQGVLGVLNAIAFGCLGALIADLFPTALRTSGLSLSNALTQMTLGGTTPFICVWLIEATGRAEAPAFYLMFAAALSIAALMALRGGRGDTDEAG
jgi:MHS family proline/betaine transporter-like MFS transporter